MIFAQAHFVNVFEEKDVNVGEACSPTGFESSFEGPGRGKGRKGLGEGVAEGLGSCADTGPGAFRVTQAIARPRDFAVLLKSQLLSPSPASFHS
jgi:hypothetical protein